MMHAPAPRLLAAAIGARNLPDAVALLCDRGGVFYAEAAVGGAPRDHEQLGKTRSSGSPR